MASRGLSRAAWQSPAAPLGLAVVGAWLVWSWREGAIEIATFGPSGIVLALAVALTATATRAPAGFRRGLRLVALAAMGVFAGWSFLSIVWADFPGAAWEGSNRSTLAVLCFVAFALWPWNAAALHATLAAFSLGTASLGAVVLVRAVASGDPAARFDEGRLLGTIGYPNADVALWTMGALAGLAVAARRDSALVLRAGSLGGAALLTSLSVLGQSRAWLFLLPVSLALAVLLTRQRLRLVLALAILVAAVLPALPALLDVFPATDGPGLEAALDRAGWFVLLAMALAAGAAVTWALADRRVELPARMVRALGSALAIALVAAVAGAAVLALARVDSPRAWVSSQWRDFTRGYAVGEADSRFTGSLGTGRYLIWTVAWREFLDHPVAGIGTDNFEGAYLARRTNNFEEPIHPHSTPLRILSQLGVIGAVLLAVSVVAAVWLALSRRKRLSPGDGSAVGMSLTLLGFWLVNGSVDVFWETPVLASVALGFLGLASAVEPDERLPTVAGGTSRMHAGRRLVALGCVWALAIALALSLLAPTLSDAWIREAAAERDEGAEHTYALLDRAARADPLAARALIVKGRIALESGNTVMALATFERAAEREPENWYPRLQLALIAASSRDYMRASELLADVRRLNPRDSLARVVSRLVEARQPVDPAYVNGLYALGLNHQSVAYLITRHFQVPPFVEP